jgi:hypothetical protein
LPDEASEDVIGFIGHISDSPEEQWKIQFSAGQKKFFCALPGTLEHNYDFFDLIRWIVFKEEEDVPKG